MPSSSAPPHRYRQHKGAANDHDTATFSNYLRIEGLYPKTPPWLEPEYFVTVRSWALVVCILRVLWQVRPPVADPSHRPLPMLGLPLDQSPVRIASRLLSCESVPHY